MRDCVSCGKEPAVVLIIRGRVSPYCMCSACYADRGGIYNPKTQTPPGKVAMKGLTN